MSQAQAIAPDFSPEQTNELVNVLTEDFLVSGRPIDALNAFCDCRDMGLPVHEAVMEWLHQRFTEYRSKKGSVSLDKIMGLVPSRGRKPPYKEELLRQRNFQLLKDVATLRGLGHSAHEAAILVAGKIQAIPNKDWRAQWPGLDKPNENTILERYWKWDQRKKFEERYKRRPPFSGFDPAIQERLLRKFLSSFPDLR